MAALAIQKIVDAGTDYTLGAAGASDTANIGNGLNTFVVVKNGDGVNAKTVTIPSHFLMDNGDTGPSHVVTVAANATARIPLRKSYDDGTGSATINITGTGGLGSVQTALVRLG